MFRQSIYENKDRYIDAVKKVIELKKQEIEVEEIPKRLSSLFQEKEILGLINDLNKLPTLNGNQGLKNVLNFSLWAILIVRLFFVTNILSASDVSILWKISAFVLSFIIIGSALYFTYKESFENVFFILLISLMFSLDAFFEIAENLFTFSLFSINWWFGLILIVASLLSFFVSWKLKNIYSKRLLNLKYFLKKEKLYYT